VAKKVSIILVNYNSMPHLDTCIPSVLNQTYPNIEIIFVDNNSSDGSFEYTHRKFPQLVFVANNRNLGYAGGINAGLVHTTGEYIAPLNIDTEVSANWLSEMVHFLDLNPKVAAVTPKILLFDERSKINALGSNIHITGLGFCRGLNKPDNNSTEPQKVSGVSGCSYLIRREILEQMGGAPEECFMGNDDVVLSWLVNLMDYEMYCLPKSVVYHKYKLKMDPEKFFILERNRSTLLLYSLKPLTFVALSPVLAFTELLIFSYSLLEGRRYIQAKFKAYAAVWRNRAYIRKRRGQVQKLRRISDFELLKRLRWDLEWGQLLHISK
jgi:GT2 family glycosyltransferase